MKTITVATYSLLWLGEDTEMCGFGNTMDFVQYAALRSIRYA